LRLFSDHYDDDDDDGEDDAHVHDSLMDAMLRYFIAILEITIMFKTSVSSLSTCRGMKEKYVNRLEGIFRAPWRSSKFQKSSHHFTSVKLDARNTGWFF